MHARVTTGQIQPGKMNELVSIYRDSILPATKQQQGNRGAFVLTDSNTGKVIAISLWETEADATATGAGSAYVQEQFAKLAQAVAGQPTLEQYEVSVQV